jgi:Zn-dependent peptidase ImmA (M78 family)
MANELEILKAGMSSSPVDVEGIIRKLGITYRNEPMANGESGFIEHENGDFTITVDSTEGRQRQRFTAAHELAHYLLHREKLVQVGGLSRHSDSLYDGFADGNPPQPFSPSHEVEANRLAAQILMPKEAVTSAYNSRFDNVDEVAMKFGVSMQAMSIRLKTLGLR